jgi:hypothetical protein
MTRPPTRPRAWGAPPEPIDDRDDPSREDEAPKRAAPPPKRSGAVSPVTLALGLIVLVFGVVVIARRWKHVRSAIDLHRITSGTREAMAELSALTGMPTEGFGDVGAAYGGYVVPLWIGGILGLIAGAMFVLIGGLILLRNPLSVQPGARGLLVGAGVFALAHLGDVWIGYRTVSAWEDAMRRTQEALAGNDPLRTALSGAYGRMVEAAGPSHGDYLIEVLLWVVPTLVIALWASRYLDSPEVRGPLGLR